MQKISEVGAKKKDIYDIVLKTIELLSARPDCDNLSTIYFHTCAFMVFSVEISKILIFAHLATIVSFCTFEFLKIVESQILLRFSLFHYFSR